MRLTAFAFVVVLPVALAGCPRDELPSPPPQCDPAGDTAGKGGCLSDEICVDFTCVPRPRCERDDDCGSGAYACVLPAQVCELRAGFGEECKEPEAPCAPGQFCALGVCRPVADAIPCARRTDCPVGQACDRLHFYCIEETACTLADEYPEVACDPGAGASPGETCDVFTQRCQRPCQQQCTVATVEADCGPGQRCNGSCECVQCITTEDCGAGLVCNARAGRCQSANLCFTDDDCEPPLECAASQLCQVPPPACFDDFDCAVSEACDLASGRCFEPQGPCIDDRFEEADTPASAEILEVPASGAPRFEDELRLCPDDDDVYAIALDAGDLLLADVTRAEPSARATAWLLDATGERSLRFTETPPRGDGRITYVAQEEETVFLRINALGAQTVYDLTLSRQSGVPCQPDFFEGATGNDELATATPPELVPDGVALAGTVCPGDEDLFRVQVAAGEALSATLAFDGTVADLDVAFLDEAGAVIVQDAGSGAPEAVRRRFVTNETVYVRVRGFGTDTGSYSLTVDHEAPFVCAADAFEPDDDNASATVLALGEQVATVARTICSGDQDRFLVPLEDFERLIVSARYNDADVELAVDILDPAIEPPNTGVKETSPPATGGAAVSYDAQGNETVVVRIRGVGGTVGPYTLSIAKENQLQCTPDAREPNNTAAAASALPGEGQLLAICESDQDFFIVDGAAGKKLIVDASFRHADGDIDLMLLGIDPSQILAVADGTTDGERLEVLLPLDGLYTLRVFALTSGASAPYTLSVDQVTP